jgi:hypothetical protein
VTQAIAPGRPSRQGRESAPSAPAAEVTPYFSQYVWLALPLGGQDLLLRLKNAVRAHYGITAEKLAEFGLNPPALQPGFHPVQEKPPETGPIPAHSPRPEAR